MQVSKSSFHQHPQAESDDEMRFDQSLQELKDLRSQLHRAADYCEATFSDAKHKQIVVENTKEYICRAVVTVVDHLGSVSSNLDYGLSKTNTLSEIELRMDCLKLKLMTCQQYSNTLALRKVCWNADFPRYHPRYISPPTTDLQRSNEQLRNSGTPVASKTINKHEFETDEEAPLFLYTYKPSLDKDSTMDIGVQKRKPVLPVREGLSILPKPQRPSFHFQETRKLRRHMLNWKSVQNNDLMSLIRRNKKTT